jgi:hypothetical protein
VIFLVLELAATVTHGGALWVPVRMTAAIVMGHNVLTNEVGFEASVMLFGLVVHFALSAIRGLNLAAI